MTSTIANSTSAPTTLTLNPFHNGSQLRQNSARQPYVNAPQHAGGARIAPNAHHAQSSSRQVPNLPSLRIPRNVPVVRTPQNPQNTSNPSGPNSSNNRPMAAPMANSRNAVRQSTQPASTAVIKQGGNAGLRGYAIAPIANTSIDSILRADTKKSEVPHLIRSKAEAIK